MSQTLFAFFGAPWYSISGFSRFGNRRKKDTMELIQSTAANFPIFMFDSSDHVSGKTGLTLTIAVSKNGGASAAITPTVTEIGNGRYNLALTTAHIDTLGPINGIVTAAGADPQPFEALVVLAKALDSTVAKDATVSKPGTAQTISSNSDITAIKAKTDNLPASPAAVSNIPTVAQIADGVWDEAISGHLTAGSTGASLNGAGSAGDPWTTTLPGTYGDGTAGKIIGDNVNASIAAVKAKTDNLPASPAAVSNIPTAAANASAVRTELTTELGRIDAAVSTRSAPATAQTISSNSDITAIKAKTDNLPASPAAVGSAMTLATGAITAAVIATDAIDADSIATDAITEIQSGLSRPGTAQTITAPADMALDSTVAKEATLVNRPTLAQIEASTVLAQVSDIPTAIAITEELLDTVLVAGVGGKPDLTLRLAIELAGTISASKKSGMIPGQAGTALVRKYDDSKVLLTIVQDANSNTTSVTVTP